MTSTDHEFRPTGAPERIDMLDAIRGFALFGILLMNLEAFTGPYLQAMSGVDPALSGADWLADAFVYVFVQGKFWTLFSLLFGVGFALMQDGAQRARADFSLIYSRRLMALAVFGLAHALLLWEGDILFTYALAGAVLLWRVRAGTVPRLWRIVAVYAAPLLLIALLGLLEAGPAEPQALADAIAREAEIQGAGSYAEISAWRLEKFAQGLGGLVVLLPMAVAMFALGVRLHRSGFTRPPERSVRADALRALALFAAGLALTLAGVAVSPDVDPLRIDVRSAAVGILNLLGAPLMCLGYFFALRWLWGQAGGRRWLARFAPAGRMALSNYLGQSLLCTLLFYGYGAGLFGQLPRAWQIPFAVAVFGAQLAFSRWWLARFGMGPMEHLWRRLTYGARLKFVS
ncbi:MAG: DUF418 domain-containing protein [Arenimonas sp.]